MDARIKSGHDIPNGRTAMRSLIVLALPLLIASSTANAQSGTIGFQSPSKNIACAYFDYDNQNTLRCDIMEATVTARRPADCDLEWGKAFEMRSKGGAVRLCYGDTVMDPKMPVLAYGEVWQRGGFTCKSEQSGVTCFNADRRGFSLARAKQEVF
jgi:hypothetical protein